MVAGLNPDNEAFLLQLVISGQFPSREAALNQAVEALREKTNSAPPRSVPPKTSLEEWERSFREWASNHPRTSHFVDDSRESIYEGCGE